MVLFKCKTCAASVMHRDVGKHVGKCAGPLALRCVDCNREFFGQQYETHSSCYAPRVAEMPQTEVTEEPRKKPDAAKNPTAPKIKGGKQIKKGVPKTAVTTQNSSVLQEQWKQAGLIASQDPSLTEQQKALLVYAHKQRAPLKINNRTVKQVLLSITKTMMPSFRVVELVQEVLRMVESELKNINAPQKEDATKLTKNQKLIGSILAMSEAPGLTPHLKSLLASHAEDKPKQDRLVKDYARVTGDICHHRIELVASQAFKRFEAEFLKIRGIKSLNRPQKKNNKKKNIKKENRKKQAADRNNVEPRGNMNGTVVKPQINGAKEDNTEPEVKKEKRKKRKGVDKSTENEVARAENIVDTEIDITRKKSKKRKHKEDVEIAEAEPEEETAHKKRKKEKKSAERAEAAAEEMTNGFTNGVTDDAASKKSKKHKNRSESVGEEADGSAEAELVQDSERNSKKKKHKRQGEAEDDGKTSKKDKKGRAVEVEI